MGHEMEIVQHYRVLIIGRCYKQLQNRAEPMGNIFISCDDQRIKTRAENKRNLSFATASMRGWRPYMEDTEVAVYPLNDHEDIGIFAIFDGHGGPEVSNFAKNHLVPCLTSNINFIMGHYQKALGEALLKLDEIMLTPAGQEELQQIRQAHSTQGNAVFYSGRSFAGSTANIVLVARDYIYCANIGDSRSIAAIRPHPTHLEIRGLSLDHKPWAPGERERIVRAGGFVNHEGRINNNLNLSRAIGDFDYKSNHALGRTEQMIISVPEVSRTLRKDVQFILMGCDGIWETKDNQTMAQFVMRKNYQHMGELELVLKDLFHDEMGAGPKSPTGTDNMTGILIYFH